MLAYFTRYFEIGLEGLGAPWNWTHHMRLSKGLIGSFKIYLTKEDG
jgi:hypothetical protein